jgi:hypothetical protein
MLTAGGRWRADSIGTQFWLSVLYLVPAAVFVILGLVAATDYSLTVQELREAKGAAGRRAAQHACGCSLTARAVRCGGCGAEWDRARKKALKEQGHRKKKNFVERARKKLILCCERSRCGCLLDVFKMLRSLRLHGQPDPEQEQQEQEPEENPAEKKRKREERRARRRQRREEDAQRERRYRREEEERVQREAHRDSSDEDYESDDGSSDSEGAAPQRGHRRAMARGAGPSRQSNTVGEDASAPQINVELVPLSGQQQQQEQQGRGDGRGGARSPAGRSQHLSPAVAVKPRSPGAVASSSAPDMVTGQAALSPSSAASPGTPAQTPEPSVLDPSASAQSLAVPAGAGRLVGLKGNTSSQQSVASRAEQTMESIKAVQSLTGAERAAFEDQLRAQRAELLALYNERDAVKRAGRKDLAESLAVRIRDQKAKVQLTENMLAV